MLNSEKSVCNNGATVEWESNKLITSNLTKSGTSCYLYFDEKVLVRDTILANKTISTRNDFSTILTTDTTGIIFQTDDDYGTTYYFAGNPSDNWLRFGGYWWRIIRINGNESVRIIYNGKIANQTGEETQIGTSPFNNYANDNMYIGYMYSSGESHGVTNNSVLKTYLENWYTNNLLEYTDYIDSNAGFCNDRTPISGNGIGTEATTYAPYYRLSTNKSPSLKCINDSDLFKTKIGTITADEVAFAGGVGGGHAGINNENYYLYTNSDYYTLSPTSGGNASGLYYVGINGNINTVQAMVEFGVRPVINLKADVQLTGTGTVDDPYVVVGAE